MTLKDKIAENFEGLLLIFAVLTVFLIILFAAYSGHRKSEKMFQEGLKFCREVKDPSQYPSCDKILENAAR